MTNYFPLVGSTVAAIFMTLLLYKYATTKKRYHFVWTVAIFMVFFTSFLELLSEFGGWSVASYKAYYILTAPLVALMGLGTLFLLTHKNWSKYFLVYAVVFSAIFMIAGATATVDETAFTSGSQIGGGAMPSYVRAMSPLLTIPGGIILIVGALYSFWLDRTRKYNPLIGLGGLLYMAAGMLARMNVLGVFYAIQTVSLLFLFLGFLLSMEYRSSLKVESSKVEGVVT
jgi:hypothetical protein